MKSNLKSSRGQALILIAFALIGLVGITGLAVDGGLTFSDRRHAQNAADTAALAGAMAKIYIEENGATLVPKITEAADMKAYWQGAAWGMAEKNGYYDDIVNSEVDVYSCTDDDSSCGYYDDNPDYVQVIITSHINTFFARVIGITQMHNQVQAIALADDDDSGPLYNGESIIALSKECQSPDNFIVQGSADVTVTGGGLYVNTDDPACGFKCDTNGGSITADITTAGGDIDTSTKCGSSVNGTMAEGGGDPWDFPVTLDDVGLDVPSECTSPPGTYQNFPAGYTYGSYPSIPGPVTVLTPGSYPDFPLKKDQEQGNLYDRIYMQPGVYCVNNVVKLTETNLTLIGYDVTLFIRDGYAFNLNGGTIKLDAPETGQYAGYLMIVEPNYAAAPENCTINGNTSNVFEGGIFAPYCNITINGGSEPTGFESQVVGYTVKITGTSTIDFTYEEDDNPYTNQPAETGIIK